MSKLSSSKTSKAFCDRSNHLRRWTKNKTKANPGDWESILTMYVILYIYTYVSVYIYCIYVCNYTMYKNHTNFTNGFQMPHPLKAQVSGIVFSGSKTPGAPKKPKKMIASALKSRTHPAEVSEFFYGNFGKRLEAMGLVRP